MNIQSVIDYLNKEKGRTLTADYFKYIKEWKDWWKGYYEPFHQYKERGYDGAITERKLYTLKMAKKVCEDWASMLLNEKTEIVISDEASSVFVHGVHSEDTNADEVSGVFDDNNFWLHANALIEKTFCSGTGAFVLRFDEMKLKGGVVIKSAGTKIRMEYLSSPNIIPLTIRHGKLIDVAFVSDVMEKGETFVYIETHELGNGGYEITNQYFKETDAGLTEKPLPAGMLGSYSTGTSIPLFSIVSPNIVNNIDENTGLGISVYANALDNLEGCDLAYNNLNRDFKLGGKKVFLNEQLTKQDERGNVITPDDVAQQLFTGFGDGFIDKDGKNNLIHEFNPALRVQENKDGIQAQLDYLSFKCGLGTKHYQFNAGQIVTATQYLGDKQELIQNASKHYIAVERALKGLVKAILWAGREICGQAVNPDTRVSVKFDDSYIIDKESERLRDQQEVRDGLMQKWEYRVKWHGEDETTAKKMVGANQTDEERLGFTRGDG